MSTLSKAEREALERLIKFAAEGDSGASAKCASFLLAWWNADENGGFDLTDLWGVDPDLQKDMLTVILLICRNHGKYADAYGYEQAMKIIWDRWINPGEEDEKVGFVHSLAKFAQENSEKFQEFLEAEYPDKSETEIDEDALKH